MNKLSFFSKALSVPHFSYLRSSDVLTRTSCAVSRLGVSEDALTFLTSCWWVFLVRPESFSSLGSHCLILWLFEPVNLYCLLYFYRILFISVDIHLVFHWDLLFLPLRIPVYTILVDITKLLMFSIYLLYEVSKYFKISPCYQLFLDCHCSHKCSHNTHY